MRRGVAWWAPSTEWPEWLWLVFAFLFVRDGITVAVYVPRHVMVDKNNLAAAGAPVVRPLWEKFKKFAEHMTDEGKDVEVLRCYVHPFTEQGGVMVWRGFYLFRLRNVKE